MWTDDFWLLLFRIFYNRSAAPFPIAHQAGSGQSDCNFEMRPSVESALFIEKFHFENFRSKFAQPPAQRPETLRSARSTKGQESNPARKFRVETGSHEGERRLQFLSTGQCLDHEPWSTQTLQALQIRPSRILTSSRE